MPATHALQLLRRQHARARRLLAEALAGNDDSRSRLIPLLRAHVSLEEEHVLAKLEDDDAVAGAVDDAYREHEVLGEILVELEALPAGDPQIKALLDELDELLTAAVSLEENTLFPYIERAWPTSLLDEVGQRIAARLPQMESA